MDHNNIEALHKLARDEKDAAKIKPFAHFPILQKHDVVPDPYYGGDDGFELVLDILEDGCSSIIDQYRKKSS
jgi:protein-tyrosine phosphatase